MKTAWRTFLAALVLMASSASYAASDDFGTLLSGSFQPSDTFATLTYSTTDNLVYNFTLTAYDLDSIFTSGAFIGAIAVDADANAAVSNVSGDTVVSVAP
ncbi:MAG TPA: PEP-CTERM sorting domain-containing protein, partial [Methylophilaceae bacterium]|nr:PEP-CTERM sorting domain-containing protein [Methylophilaceae bacterium]